MTQGLPQLLPKDRWPLDAGAMAFLGVCGLCLAAPFEKLQPLMHLPWQQVTNVELVTALAVGGWLLTCALQRSLPRLATAATTPALALLAALLLSALAAPSNGLNAFKVVVRLAIAATVFLLTVNGVRDAGRMRAALALASIAGAIVGACALGEYLGLPRVLQFLDQFRDGVRVVGGQIRASGTLQYPTITSMYLEVVFAFSLGLFVSAIDEAQWIASGFLLFGLLLIAEGITLTFTRAGVVTMAVSLALVGAWRVGRRGFDRGVWALSALAVLVAALLISSWSAESLHLRFTSENRQGWYRATFDVPAEVAFDAGEIQSVDVIVTNDGRITWQGAADTPFYASYHWIDAQSTRVIEYDGIRTAFPRALAPGETATLEMDVRAPVRAGRYRIVWDVVQEHRLWFGTELGAPITMTAAEVTGVATTKAPARTKPMPPALPAQVRTVGRGTLWMAALRILAGHPLLGIGLDNYRLVYGSYAGLDRADPRVHTNDLYLEVLSGGGLLAGGLLCWLFWRVASTLPLRWERLRGTTVDALFSGVAAAACAILLHGLVDSFLTFTPTYLAIAITLGLLVAPVREVREEREEHHAYRV